jgi:hypothetical protein
MTIMGEEHASFLRLERYRLRELSAREERMVATHLAACAPCRACLAEVEREVALPQLPALSSAPEPAAAADLNMLRDELARAKRRRRALLSSQIAGALALAAAALLMLRPLVSRQTSEHVPPERIGMKGGDVALELVRKRGDAIANDADVFADGDAFKVLLTCPPPLAPRFEVVVYQDGQAYFPLEGGVLPRCGNRRALGGAFTLDGPHDALVCVALGEHGVPARSALRRGPDALPALSVCTRVLPASTR